MNRILFYFGCIGQIGHYLFAQGERSAREFEWGKIAPRGFRYESLDGLFVPDGPGYKESTVPPLRIVSWIDNTVDSRPGSHSTFAGRGYESAEQMLDDAAIRFPSVMKRQARPIRRLVEPY